VKIRRAKDLLHASGTCDPFLMLSVQIPGRAAIPVQKSRIHKATYGPVFDDTFTFTGVTSDVMEQGVLVISVHDNLLPEKKNVIGALKFKIGRLGLDLIMPTWLPLKRALGMWRDREFCQNLFVMSVLTNYFV